MIMNNATISRISGAKSSLRVLVSTAAKYKRNQAELLSECDAIITHVFAANKATPGYASAELRSYFNGLSDGVIQPQIIHLYNVDGQLYRLSKDKQIDLPCWDELPRDMWSELGDKGGRYWSGSLAPYFIANV
jgi:hypothetical protein